MTTHLYRLLRFFKGSSRIFHFLGQITLYPFLQPCPDSKAQYHTLLFLFSDFLQKYHPAFYEMVKLSGSFLISKAFLFLTQYPETLVVIFLLSSIRYPIQHHLQHPIIKELDVVQEENKDNQEEQGVGDE